MSLYAYTPETRPYLKPRDLAERWGVPERTVLRLMETGVLRAFRIGRAFRIRHDYVPDALPVAPPRERAPPKERKKRPGPTLPPVGVYMLFLASKLVYVGRSTDIPKRISTHRRSGRAFDEVRAIPCDSAVADWLEAELIRTMSPPQNIKRFERRAKRVTAALEAMSL